MYSKDLTEDFRLRLSKTDMDFLRDLSSQRSCSVSECVRTLIGEYRRGLETLKVLAQVSNSIDKKEGELFNGDTKTYFNS